MSPSWSDVGDFMFGQSAQDVTLADPELEAARQRRALLEERFMAQLGGGQTAGEAAILEAAQTGADQIAASAQGQAAGARGFGRLAAASEAGNRATVGQQQLLGSAATQAGAQRSQDLARAEAGLAGLNQAELAQWQLEQAEKEKRRKPGALPVIGALAGGAIGGATTGSFEGAQQGAQIGGAAGGGFAQFGQAWT